MAQMLEVLEELSRLDGRPVETLHHVMKVLRTSGHVQRGRRGVTSPVEAETVANLLLACMSGAMPADTPRAVEVYSGLKPKRRGGMGRGFFPALELASQCETFGQALTLLIEQAPRFKAQAMACLMLLFDKMDPQRLIESDLDLRFSLEITLQQRPIPYAVMTLSAPNERGLDVTEWTAEWLVDAGLYMNGYYRPETQGRSDLRTQTTTTHRTIFRLGDLLAAADEENDDEASRIEGQASPEDRRDAAASGHGGERKPGSQRHRVDSLHFLAR